jgi:hypothetical protein
MSKGIYTPDVTDILDLFYANDGHEPDWAAIRTRLHRSTESYFNVTIGLLRAFHAVYEDQAAFTTLMYRLKEDLPD